MVTSMFMSAMGLERLASKLDAEMGPASVRHTRRSVVREYTTSAGVIATVRTSKAVGEVTSIAIRYANGDASQYTNDWFAR